jgi:magnesium chelatase accessory protein
MHPGSAPIGDVRRPSRASSVAGRGRGVDTISVTDGLSWEQDGRDWPNREASRFVRLADMNWHLQEMGEGPVLLLLHGTGASSHSWRDLAPLLAGRFRVVAPDLPGHGFTEAPPRQALSLPGMARAVAALLRQSAVAPVVVVGHSAGAAVAIRMSLDGSVAPGLIVGVNAALLPLHGIAAPLFSPLAKILARIPAVPRLLARKAFDRQATRAMLARTGSTIDARGVDLYCRLAQSPSHVAAALGMMAEWDLPSLEKDLRNLRSPLLLVAAEGDRTIPPTDAERVRRLVPGSEVVPIEKLGHLAHEERPALVAEIVFDAAERAGILAGRG